MFDLTEKTALVTGASGGIGAAVAKALHAQGASVALSGTNLDKLTALASELGERAYVTPCNLSDLEAVDKLPAQAVEAMGSLDILVSNAGVTRDQLFMRMKEEDWDTVLKVNLSAYYRLAKAALRSMTKKRFGRIIGITSVVGVTGNPGQANYAASKAGMIGMSKSLAQEIATRGVTVNCVAPGFIGTAMTEALTDQQKEMIALKIPAGAMGTPDDIASAVVYLASAEAGYMTGQTLHINGGMAMI
ncbi:3-oxoacyl-[acyl-carrier-protein] reductase [Parvularcula sp. IMCC14364]|uniref:3-oxoacyl-[acyl-carrier-protein] reductase n=1 Tax=Parvularcula sp. IMCC14364 TaxID=3067902 RepID=UPI002741BA3F|nr:3-oxoacyl-[acyl-carrier-protein] reductase [Parvularcula sp. IMCC14364]